VTVSVAARTEGLATVLTRLARTRTFVPALIPTLHRHREVPVTTTIPTPPDLSIQAARLAATRDRLDRACAHVAQLRRELQRCEDDVRRLTDDAYRQLARMWTIDAEQQR
jgi:hypothetical protein